MSPSANLAAASVAANQYFSPARFGRLFARHTAEYLRGYLLTAAVGAGGMLVVLGFIAYLSHGAPSLNVQGVLFTLFLPAAGSFFASTVFAQFSDKRQASGALLLPASHLEKYLVAWLYSLPIFLLVFVPLFYLVDAIVVHLGAAPGQAPELLNVLNDHAQLRSILWFLAMLHAVGLWGAIFFEKMHFVKMAFALFVLMGIVSAFNFRVLKSLLGTDVRFTPPFTVADFMEAGTPYTLPLPDAQAAWLGFVPLALAGLLWLAAYFRLTEKQL